MKCFGFLCSALITIFGFDVADSLRTWNPRCPQVRLLHGRTRLRAEGRILKSNCIVGYVLVGHRYSNCIGNTWVPEPPVCVSTHCPRIYAPKNGQLTEIYNGAVVKFFCEPGYELHGPTDIYCDGRTWNDTAPTCSKTRVDPPTSCDFENPDLCGWEQDPSHDFDWTRHNFNTPSWTIGTGPSHDHTLGVGESGYYLYIEASDKLENSSARIVSPLYSSNLTETGCFTFWYHMFGRTIGALNVYFKLEGDTNSTLMFHESGNRGNRWLPGFFYLRKSNTNFQLIVEGVRGQGYVSDIAVDDFAILQGSECASAQESLINVIPTNNYDQIEIVNGEQSCFGKCTYANTTDPNSLCQCGLFCFEYHNCCPDYEAYCFLETNTTADTNSTDDPISIETTSRLVTTKLPSTASQRVPIPINPKDDIDPYPPKNPEKSNQSTAVPTTINKTTVVVTTKKPHTSTRTTRTVMVVTKNKPQTSTTTTRAAVLVTTRKPQTISSTAHAPGTNGISTEKYHAPNRDISKVTLPGIIGIVVGAIVGIAGTGLIVYLVLQKRNSYKNNSGTSALSDDSDVRFLTSDEILDFNIARPEDMEIM